MKLHEAIGACEKGQKITANLKPNPAKLFAIVA
jgi:hypothetical protein